MKPHFETKVKQTIDQTNLLLQIQRSPDTKIDDFMFEIGHYLKLLEPVPASKKTIANIASGNGLHNLVFHAFYSKVISIDPHPVMIEHAKTICRNLSNVDYIIDYGQNLHHHLEPKSIDDAFMTCVASILTNRNDLFDIFNSISTVLKRPGRLVIGNIANALTKNQYLSELPGILKRKRFDEIRIQKVIHDNQALNYYEPSEIEYELKKMGAKSFRSVQTNVQHIGHECQFDAIADF